MGRTLEGLPTNRQPLPLSTLQDDRSLGPEKHRSLPKSLKALVSATLFSAIFLSSLGVAVGTFPLRPSFVLLCVLFIYALVSSHIRPSIPLICLYAAVVFAGLLSQVANADSSPTSFLLLAVLYFPFAFRVRGDWATGEWLDFCLKRYVSFVTVVALCGIAQYPLQFFIKAPWLFNISTLLPDFISFTGTFNTAIDIGGSTKSNGIFLREPSALSGLSGFALLIELIYYRRLARMTVFCAAILFSYSGSGILALLVGLLAPSDSKSLLRNVIALSSFTILYYLFRGMLNFDYFVGRLDEFSTEGTSGYARFIAPIEFVHRELAFPEWAPLIGHGPGTIDRYISYTQSKFEIFDPTWAKLVFEYGFLGGGLVLFLFLGSFGGRLCNLSIRAAFLYGWLFQGLLDPDSTCVMLILIAWSPPTLARPILKPIFRGAYCSRAARQYG